MRACDGPSAWLANARGNDGQNLQGRGPWDERGPRLAAVVRRRCTPFTSPEPRRAPSHALAPAARAPAHHHHQRRPCRACHRTAISNASRAAGTPARPPPKLRRGPRAASRGWRCEVRAFVGRTDAGDVVRGCAAKKRLGALDPPGAARRPVPHARCWRGRRGGRGRWGAGGPQPAAPGPRAVREARGGAAPSERGTPTGQHPSAKWPTRRGRRAGAG